GSTSPADGATVTGSVTVGMSETGTSGTPISFTLSLDSTQVYTTSGTATSASYAWNSASVAKSWRSSITRVVRGGPRHGPPHPPTLGAPRGTRGAPRHCLAGQRADQREHDEQGGDRDQQREPAAAERPVRHLESAFRVPRRRARLLEAVVPLDQGNEADDRQAEAETAEPDGKGPAERGAALERPPAARAQRDAEQPLSGRRSPCRQQRALDEDPREDDEEAEQVAVDGLDHDRRELRASRGRRRRRVGPRPGSARRRSRASSPRRP